MSALSILSPLVGVLSVNLTVRTLTFENLWSVIDACAPWRLEQARDARNPRVKADLLERAAGEE